jgi:outer membrane protein assembly factor BamB
MSRTTILGLLVLVACGGGHAGPDGSSGAPPECASWRQWGNSTAHDGASCVTGQPLRTRLADMVYDPYIAQEVADANGVLIVHYQTPLVDGDALFMMTKKGTYTPCHPGSDGPSCFDPDELYRLSSQIWSEQAFTIARDGSLSATWGFDSDWKPPPLGTFEVMFQPALSGTLIAIPGAGGAVWELDAKSGQVVRHVQPFGATIDPNTYVAGGLAAGQDGTIYYNALTVDHDSPGTMSAQAWLVAVAPDGTARTADYATLVTGAPQATDSCVLGYATATTPLPWPPVNPDGSLVVPPSAACGAQRPGLNTTPAIAADGTIFLVSRAHHNPRYAYVVAVNRDLTPKWATSLRGYLHDDCGVSTVSDGTETEHTFDCRDGTPVGVERVTGLPPAPLVSDDSSSSPVALPDGGVLYGALTFYNASRGHLMKLDRTGAIVGSFDFGWDSTPAVFGDANAYKIIIKDNHYGTDANGVDHGPFYITELDASLSPVWRFPSTNTQSCAHQPDGSLSCVDDHPNGFEWCINAPAVDRDGTVYVNSEDGNAFAIRPDGTERALGAAYTPTALDPEGRVVVLNSGHLSILGK